MTTGTLANGVGRPVRADSPWWSAAFAASLLLLAGGAAGRAAARQLWHDEIFTLYIARLPDAAAIWRAIGAGVDLNPPLYHLAAHWAIRALGPSELAVRLPAVAGFVLAAVCLHAFVRRVAGSPLAVLAALIPALTGGYLYAYEGRPYGLVLGLTALALLAWQRRGDPRWRRAAPAVCALAVAAAAWTHYYAVLIALPLAAGEMARSVARRRIDWPMWAAFSGAALAISALLPLARSARTFAATFWSRPAVADLIQFYSQLLTPLSLVLLAAAVALTIHRYAPIERHQPASEPAARGEWALPLPEAVAALTLLAIPVAGFALALFSTGAFHQRYVLFGSLGFAVLLPAWIRSLGLGRDRTAILVLVCFIAFAGRQAGGIAAFGRRAPDPLGPDRALAAQAGGPVVVSHALVFLPLAHYGPASGPAPVTYLMRPPAVVRETGVDTGARALERLATIAPLQVEPYARFVQSHPHFFVYGPASWLVPQLLRDGASVQLVSQRGDRSLYRVSVQTADFDGPARSSLD